MVINIELRHMNSKLEKISKMLYYLEISFKQSGCKPQAVTLELMATTDMVVYSPSSRRPKLPKHVTN